MNIKSSFINYLKDKNYIIGIYDNSLYIYNYQKLIDFNNKEVILVINNNYFYIGGNNLKIVRLEKRELLINGKITSFRIEDINE